MEDQSLFTPGSGLDAPDQEPTKFQMFHAKAYVASRRAAREAGRAKDALWRAQGRPYGLVKYAEDGVTEVYSEEGYLDDEGTNS